jgi:hypothetical protein
MNTRVLLVAFFAGSMVTSCDNIQPQKHGAIVLGDSSTIVTEKDPQKLQDLVTDLQPVIPTAEIKDTVKTEQPAAAQKAPDTAKKAIASLSPKAPPILSGNALTIDFNIASMVIANVTAKQAGNPDLSRANGAVYTWISGVINGSLLKVTANVTKVSQRYQTVVLLKNELGTLPLESLSTTTSWQPLKGSDNIYRVSGLDNKSLDVPDADKRIIRNAVQKAARRHRMSRRKTGEWEESVRNVRSAGQKPLYVILRSVIWKIDGKDANGKIFSKQVRIDMPL